MNGNWVAMKVNFILKLGVLDLRLHAYYYYGKAYDNVNGYYNSTVISYGNQVGYNMLICQ